MNLKPFVNNKDMWTDFLGELERRIGECHKKLEQVTEMSDVYKTQGEVIALRKLQKLRDKVNAE